MCGKTERARALNRINSKRKSILCEYSVLVVRPGVTLIECRGCLHSFVRPEARGKACTVRLWLGCMFAGSLPTS